MIHYPDTDCEAHCDVRTAEPVCLVCLVEERNLLLQQLEGAERDRDSFADGLLLADFTLNVRNVANVSTMARTTLTANTPTLLHERGLLLIATLWRAALALAVLVSAALILATLALL